MHEIMSFFFTLYTAYETMASWLSWMRPMNFLALRALKCRLTWLKMSSIGLNFTSVRNIKDGSEV